MNIKLLLLIAILAVGCQSNTSAQTQTVKTEINRKMQQVFNTEYPPALGRYKCERVKVAVGDIDDKIFFTLVSEDEYEYNSQLGRYTPSIHINKLNLEGFYLVTPPLLTWDDGYLASWNMSYYGTNSQNKSIIVLSEYPNNPETNYKCLHQGN